MENGGFKEKIVRPRKSDIRIHVDFDNTERDSPNFKATIVDFLTSAKKSDIKALVDPFRLQPNNRKRTLLDIVDRRRATRMKMDCGPLIVNDLGNGYDKTDPFIDDSDFDTAPTEKSRNPQTIAGTRSTGRFRQNIPDFGIYYGSLKFDSRDVDAFEDEIEIDQNKMDDDEASADDDESNETTEGVKAPESSEDFANIRQEIDRIQGLNESTKQQIHFYIQTCSEFSEKKSKLWRSGSLSGILMKIDDSVNGIHKPENSQLANLLARATQMKRASLLRRLNRIRASMKAVDANSSGQNAVQLQRNDSENESALQDSEFKHDFREIMNDDKTGNEPDALRKESLTGQESMIKIKTTEKFVRDDHSFDIRGLFEDEAKGIASNQKTIAPKPDSHDVFEIQKKSVRIISATTKPGSEKRQVEPIRANVVKPEDNRPADKCPNQPQNLTNVVPTFRSAHTIPARLPLPFQTPSIPHFNPGIADYLYFQRLSLLNGYSSNNQQRPPNPGTWNSDSHKKQSR